MSGQVVRSGLVIDIGVMVSEDLLESWEVDRRGGLAFNDKVGESTPRTRGTEGYTMHIARSTGMTLKRAVSS